MNRTQIGLALVVAILLGGGPAAAQGTFNPGGKSAPFKPAAPQRKPSYWPALPSEEAPAVRKPGRSSAASDPDKPESFTPYKSYKPASVFGPDGKPKK